MLVRTGRIFDLLLLAVMAITTYVYIKRAEEGKKLPPIRKIPAVDAIEEGIGRAVEKGGMVHFASGGSGGRLSSEYLGMVIASLNCLGHVAKLCARMEVPLVVSAPSRPEALPLIEGIVMDSYRAEDKLENFSRDMIRFYGRDTGAYAQGICGTMIRENCAVNINIGAWHTDCLLVLAAAHDFGAMNIGGTGRWIMMYAFAMLADYCMIAEEIYAAGALVSGDRGVISGLAAEDIGKFLAFAVIILGLIVAAISLPTFLALIGM